MMEECGFVKVSETATFKTILESLTFSNLLELTLFVPILKFAFEVHTMHCQRKECKMKDKFRYLLNWDNAKIITSGTAVSIRSPGNNLASNCCYLIVLMWNNKLQFASMSLLHLNENHKANFSGRVSFCFFCLFSLSAQLVIRFQWQSSLLKKKEVDFALRN